MIYAMHRSISSLYPHMKKRYFYLFDVRLHQDFGVQILLLLKILKYSFIGTKHISILNIVTHIPINIVNLVMIFFSRCSYFFLFKAELIITLRNSSYEIFAAFKERAKPPSNEISGLGLTSRTYGIFPFIRISTLA
jgi:hypothetical protein